MKSLNQGCLIALILFMLVMPGLPQNDFVNKRDDMCGDDPREPIELTLQQQRERRDERDNIFSDKYKEVIDYFKDNDEKELFNAFLPWAILLIIWMVIVLVSLIFFFALCCGAYKKEDANDRFWTTLSCAAFWIFIILFIAAFVFIALSMSTFFNMACAVFDIPATLIVGVNTDNDKFLGIENYSAVFGAFSNEVDNITNVNSNLFNIFTKDVSSTTNQAWAELIKFTTKYKETKIENSTGNNGTPITSIEMSPGINTRLETEFIFADLTAERLHIGTEEGRFLQNGTLRTLVKNAITEAKVQADDLQTKMEDLFNPFANSAEEAYDYSNLGYIILLIIGLLSIILMVVILITLCCWCSRDRCENCIFPSKVLLVFVGFFILFYSILCFILLVGSASMSGFCGFTGQLADGNFTVFDELNLDIEPVVLDALKICGDTDGSGDLSEVIVLGAEQKHHYTRFVDFMDGYTGYEVYTNARPNGRLEESGIPAIETDWKLYQDGTKQNFLQIATTLKSLNDLVKCDGQEFNLSNVACGDDSGCTGIADTEEFTAPACSENGSQAETDFANLKKYFTENTDLIALMINDLTAEDRPSPKLYFERGEDGLSDVKADYAAVKEQFSATFDVVNKYNTNYREVIDCRVVRKMILRFEQEVCFKYSYYVYILMVLACVSCIFLLAAAWFACCALRTDGEIDEGKEDESEGEKDVFKDDYDLDDFEEEEIIPNF